MLRRKEYSKLVHIELFAYSYIILHNYCERYALFLGTIFFIGDNVVQMLRSEENI